MRRFSGWTGEFVNGACGPPKCLAVTAATVSTVELKPYGRIHLDHLLRARNVTDTPIPSWQFPRSEFPKCLGRNASPCAILLHHFHMDGDEEASDSALRFAEATGRLQGLNIPLYVQPQKLTSSFN